MKIIFTLLFSCGFIQAGLAQNQIFLTEKSDPLTTKTKQAVGSNLSGSSGSTSFNRTVMPTVSLDKEFLVISITDHTTKTTTRRSKVNSEMTYQPSSILFNLETGNVVRQFRNSGLFFLKNELVAGNYGDVWDKTFDADDFLKKVLKKIKYEYINKLTFQSKAEINIPNGHMFAGMEKGYLSTYKIDELMAKTYLWKEESGKLRKVGEYPVSYGNISADGTMISGVNKDYSSPDIGQIIVFDIGSGKRIKNIRAKTSATTTAITRKRQLIYNYHSYDIKTHMHSMGIKVIDLQTEKELADFPEAGNTFILDDSEEIMLIHSFLTGKIKLVDLSDFSVIRTEAYSYIDKDNPFSGGASIPLKVGKGEHFLIGNPSGIINLVSNKEKRIIADIYVDHEDWAVVAKDGRVDGTPGALDKLEWREYDSSGKVVNRTSLDAAFANFFTPGLLPSLLRDEIGGISELKEQIAKAPSIEIINPVSGIKTSEQEVTVTVRATENGDPLKDLQLYVNGKLFSGNARGLKVVNTENERTFNISMISGKNIISAKAISESNYESAQATIEIEYIGQQNNSNLHILAVGIDQYANISYNLNYAVADAGAIVQNIQDRSAGIFGQTNVYTIYNQDATKEKITETFRRVSKNSKPEDVFVFFYAGHGVMSEGAEKDFYLALHGVTQLYGKDDLLKSSGISALELKTLTSEIPAQKQMLIVDACQSGGAVETFAMRGAAEEKAMIQLARSTGVTLLASTGSEQFATEFEELGHGVFTYALLDGLSGKADGGSKDSKITVKELEAYLNDTIPELTQKYKGSIQFPRSWSRGMDFPISIVND